MVREEATTRGRLWAGITLIHEVNELDDGWPESVEEQGLLLLVWRRNFRNDV